MKDHKPIFITTLILLGILLLVIIPLYPALIKDALFVICLTIAYYYVEKRMPLPTWLVILSCAFIVFHVMGLTILNLFAYYILGIGYDKWLHLSTGIVLTLAFYYWLRKRLRIRSAILISILIVLGIGSINEIIEFVGSIYLHVNSASMFSQKDLLPPSMNDLQVYDTWWDMIFNLFGGLVGAIIIIATRFGFDKKKVRS